MGFFDQSAFTVGPLGDVSRRYLTDEQTLVKELAEEAHAGQSTRDKIQATAVTLVSAVRKTRPTRAVSMLSCSNTTCHPREAYC